MGISKGELDANAKNMLLRYICRDHFTSAFYAEYVPYTQPLGIVEFLHRAWMPKGGTEVPQIFCGVPNILTVHGELWSPHIQAVLKKAGIEVQQPHSGMSFSRELDPFEALVLFNEEDSQKRYVKNVNQVLAMHMDQYNTVLPVSKSKSSRWDHYKMRFNKFKPEFPASFAQFSDQDLPHFSEQELWKLRVYNPVRAQWLAQEKGRLQGKGPSYRELLRDLAEAQVWPVFEQWGEYSKITKSKNTHELSSLPSEVQAFPGRFCTAMESALHFDPCCVMALAYYGIFLLEVGREKDMGKAEGLLKQAVGQGRKELVRDGKAHPHMHLENRPYLRAMLHLIKLLKYQGRSEEAHPYVQELRRLDIGDSYESSLL